MEELELQEVFIHSCPNDARRLCPARADIGATVERRKASASPFWISQFNKTHRFSPEQQREYNLRKLVRRKW